MTKFILVYTGAATPMDQISEEESKAIMAKWGEWMGKVGDALVDMGMPFGPGISVVDDGTTRAAAALTGYSIIEAADLNAAQGLTAGHPYFSEGKGDFSIDIFELVPVPAM